MRYVVTDREISGHDNKTVIRITREKKYTAMDWILYVLIIAVVDILLIAFGFYIGVTETAKEMTRATEEVAIVEEDIYSADVPLSEQDQRTLYAAAEEFGVDYYVMLGLIEQETDFRNISGDGGKASGYCQIWKHWWGDLMTDIGAEDLNEPRDNFRTACAIVAELTEEHGSVAGALTAYNKGSYDGTASKYAVSVLENAEAWRNRKNLL